MSIGKYFWRPIDLIGCHLVGSRFVGGHSIEEVLRTGAKLKREGYKVTYNLLGEHEKDMSRVLSAFETTLALIGEMDGDSLGNIAIKPTLYGLELGRDEFFDSAEAIIEAAREKRVEVEFDAESLCFIPDTFEVFNHFASKFLYKGFVRQCVQAHLVDILSLMDEYELWNKQIRIVKGSGVYKESESAIISDPEEVLQQYLVIARRNHLEGQVPVSATVRDKHLAGEVKKILRTRFMVDFEMLYGLFGGSLGKQLLADGHTVRIYVPFVVDWCKDAWKEYGLRRASMMRCLIWKEIEDSFSRVDTSGLLSRQ